MFPVKEKAALPKKNRTGCYTNRIWWVDFNSGILKNVDYPFIAIIFRSTLTYKGPIDDMVVNYLYQLGILDII